MRNEWLERSELRQLKQEMEVLLIKNEFLEKENKELKAQLLPADPVLIEPKPKFKGKFQEASRKNCTGRIYPSEVMEREVMEYLLATENK